MLEIPSKIPWRAFWKWVDSEPMQIQLWGSCSFSLSLSPVLLHPLQASQFPSPCSSHCPGLPTAVLSSHCRPYHQLVLFLSILQLSFLIVQAILLLFACGACPSSNPQGWGVRDCRVPHDLNNRGDRWDGCSQTGGWATQIYVGACLD